jgi:DNA-binding MarR family transcriptional regulator
MTAHDLAMAMRAAYLAMHRQTDAVLAPLGITADQFVVLSALARGEAVSQSELVSRTSSDPNTLRAMLVLLERRGLVLRRPHPSDRRARSVSLSDEGRARFEAAWKQSEVLRGRIVAGFDSNELESFVNRLRRFTRNLQPGPADGRGFLPDFVSDRNDV